MNNRPILYILIGPPGCGKSYITNDRGKQQHNKVVSSDAIREEICGDVNCQDKNEQVFFIMRTRAYSYLEEGYNVYYDATNMSRKDREQVLKECPKFAVKKALVIWAPVETLYERNANRERQVPEFVIDKMLKKFQAPYYDEGFDEIDIIYNVDLNKFDFIDYSSLIRDRCNMPQDNSHHTHSLIDHLNATMTCVVNVYCDEYYPMSVEDENLYLAAKYHDVGKIYTKTFTNARGELTEEAHYYGHQGYSAWMSYGLITHSVLYHTSGQTPEIVWLISTHMDPYLNTRYYRRLPKYLKDLVDKLHQADKAAH